MASNDFAHVSELLAESFTCDWPQSNERIVGRQNFVSVNASYPAHGPWTFFVSDEVTEGDRAVTRTLVSDGVRQDWCISLFTCEEGEIIKIIEYWPGEMEPATDRAAWTVPIKNE